MKLEVGQIYQHSTIAEYYLSITKLEVYNDGYFTPRVFAYFIVHNLKEKPNLTWESSMSQEGLIATIEEAWTPCTNPSIKVLFGGNSATS